MTLLATRLGWQQIVRSNRQAELRAAILSSFTVDPLVPYLGMALEHRGLVVDLRVGPYGQIAQECLDPTSTTATERPDIVVVWPRLEDLWAGRPLPLDTPPDVYVHDLVDIVETSLATTSWGATLVFVLPAVPEVRPLGVGDAGDTSGVFAVATAAREAARLRLADAAGVLVADAEEDVRALGTRGAIDWRRMAVARIPYREEAFAAVGERIAHLLHLARRGAAKVVAVDADNTLWGGVVGEDGVGGIDLLESGPGEAHRDFQRYLVELRRAGLLIALVSKNNEADVWAAFERREMVLKRSHLAAWRINWSPKSQSIAEIAIELNLSTASIVFIDDSPVERAEVTCALPEVHAIAMPEDAADWFDTIVRSRVLDRLAPTDADRTRAESYQEESQRRVLRESTSITDFLASLELTVEIARIEPADVARAAQLIAKTNQFTLAGPRRSEADLNSWLDDDRFILRAVVARDRFGDYGAIGVIVVDTVPDVHDVPAGAALLDTFVLSCRAMGRGIETAMLAAAFAASGSSLWTRVHDGPRNTPARQFFASFGCVEVGAAGSLQRPDWPAHVESTPPSSGDTT